MNVVDAPDTAAIPTLPAPPAEDRPSLVADVPEASDWVLLSELQGTRSLPFSVGVKTGPGGTVQACVLWARPNAFCSEPDSFDSRAQFTDAPQGVAFALTTAAALRTSKAAGLRP